MLPVEVWSSFLRARGVVLRTASVSRLEGGEVNRTWAVTDDKGREWVLRHYQRTLDRAEVSYELAAVARLEATGFPTPAPVPDRSGRLFDIVGGKPAALFTRAVGTHPVQRAGGYGSMDLTLGRQAASLAGRLHQAMAGVRLPGRRSADRDPWRRVDRFLIRPLADLRLFADVIVPLAAVHDRLAALYSDPSAVVPTGIVHKDLTPANLLLDADGLVSAVLDFDDCADTALAYELGPIISAFGAEEYRRTDPDRLSALLTAYHEVRPLTPAERHHLPDLIAVHAAAEGIDVLTGWIRAGRPVDDPRESFSVQTFLDIVNNRRGIRDTLAQER